MFTRTASSCALGGLLGPSPAPQKQRLQVKATSKLGVTAAESRGRSLPLSLRAVALVSGL